MCPQESFKEKLWIFWKTYKFFSSVHFRYKAKSFLRVYQMCIVRVKGNLLRDNYYFFERKHPLLSLSDIVRKISGVASGFFLAGLPKLLLTFLWRQYEEKRFIKERLCFFFSFLHQAKYFVPDGRSFLAVLSKRHSTCPFKPFEENQFSKKTRNLLIHQAGIVSKTFPALCRIIFNRVGRTILRVFRSNFEKKWKSCTLHV